MKLVIDKGLPVDLRLHFPDHECVTVQYLRAKGAKDGPLIQMVADHFEVFITIDGNMLHQQNFKKYPALSVVFPSAPTNGIYDLLPLVPLIGSALGSMKPGQHVHLP